MLAVIETEAWTDEVCAVIVGAMTAQSAMEASGVIWEALVIEIGFLIVDSRGTPVVEIILARTLRCTVDRASSSMSDACERGGVLASSMKSGWSPG